MSNEVKGLIKQISETQQVSEKFRKRQFVLTIDHDRQYPQHIPIELTQDKVELINNYNIGDEIKVSFNMRGNEHQGKYYLSLQAWRIELISSGSNTNNEGHDAQSTFNTNPAENDDLHF